LPWVVLAVLKLGYPFSVGIYAGILERGRLHLKQTAVQGPLSRAEPCSITILFIPRTFEQCNPETDWAVAGAEYLARQCPECASDSIIGHGRRQKQAHDEHHDWIQIRRGRCKLCGKTFTFLPLLSPPYCHYSLITRIQALECYFGEHCSLDMAAPLVKDPDRIPVVSTLRRWFCALDLLDLGDRISPRPPESPPPPLPQGAFPFLRKTLQSAIDSPVQPKNLLRSLCLQILLPLRI
jgi:hypothetical protein